MESALKTNKHTLICLNEDFAGVSKSYRDEYNYVSEHFCGNVIREPTEDFAPEMNVLVYLCGDVKKAFSTFAGLESNKNLLIVKELAFNYDDGAFTIHLGEVPINYYNVGLFFRRFFNDEDDHFKLIEKSHTFQDLTESTKEGCAYRKGIYLTDVTEDGEDLKFNLLRCSSNLKGPTDNFRKADKEVIDRVNATAQLYFTDPADLNHVLAQIYYNHEEVVETKHGEVTKERKARIKAHSDKTKDMPKNALMAFTTFYDFTDASDELHLSSSDKFDLMYKKGSVLTTLRFKLKKSVKDESFVKEFSVPLYPNSVFLIPLSTNRIYTHEIVPSNLPVSKIPTRMGYVIRSSDTPAVHRDGITYIVNGEKETELRYGTPTEFAELRERYLKENKTTDIVDYGTVDYTMNKGDLETPLA